MHIASLKRADLKRVLFIFIAVKAIPSMLLSACAPAFDQPGGG